MAVKYLNLSDKDYKKYKLKVFKKRPLSLNRLNKKSKSVKIKSTKQVSSKKDEEYITVKSPFLDAGVKLFLHGFKIVALILVALIITGVLAYYGVLEDFRKAITSTVSVNSGLVVNTEYTKSNVYLDDNLLGETPINTQNLSSGGHILKIEPIDKKEDLLTFNLEFPIYLSENRITVVKAQVGPTERTSSYSVVYSKPKINDSSPDLIVKVTPKDANIFIDDEKVGNAPLNYNGLNQGVHKIKIQADGYKPYDIEINHSKDDTIYIDAKLYEYVLPKVVSLDSNEE